MLTRLQARLTQVLVQHSALVEQNWEIEALL
jgi:hypothetical protein